MMRPKEPSGALEAIFDDPEFAAMYGERKPVFSPAGDDARVIAQFEEVNAFVDQTGCPPSDDDDFVLAARLEALRDDERFRTLLAPYDRHGLLGQATDASLPLTMDAIIAANDPIFESASDDGLFELQAVTDRREHVAAEDSAERTRCEQFAAYRPLFDRLQAGLNAGRLETKRDIDSTVKRRGVKSTVLGLTDLRPGAAFILNGVLAYIVARKEGLERTVNRVRDAHLHIVFDNGTEARDYLARSFARVLYEDPNGRQIVDATTGLPINVDVAHADLPIFGGRLELGPEDTQTGTLYVVESLSEDPHIAELRGRLYKIGFTTQRLDRRLADTETDPTFLCAPVRLVAQYTIANARPAVVESLIHEFFAAARLALWVQLGRKVEPREWFVVPLDQIRTVAPLIADRSILDYRYDRNSGTIVRR